MQLCNECIKSILRGLYFVDYFSVLLTPPQMQFLRFICSFGLGNQQIQSRPVGMQQSGIQSSRVGTEEPGLTGNKAGSRRQRNMAEQHSLGIRFNNCKTISL